MTRSKQGAGHSDLSVPGGEPVLSGDARHLDLYGDDERREALVQLRDHYVEAQKLVSSGQPHENLGWILGARRNPTQDPLGFQTQTIELIGLWLQDLIVALDEQLPDPTTGESDSDVRSAYEARQAAAQTLRDATERFLAVFRSLRSRESGSRA
jgi:hypothetical protein